MKKTKNIPEIVVPKECDLLDLIDTDDDGFDFCEPIMEEEVKINFERNDGNE